MWMERRIEKLRALLDRTMLRERESLTVRLEGLVNKVRADGVREPLLRQFLSLEKWARASALAREERFRSKPSVTYPENLPITRKRHEIISALRSHQVVIVSGETGCGKSTQLPKMCLEAGQGLAGKIGCTQPRRIAATTIARRIAEELGEELGRSVGYKIRFTDRTPRDAYVKVMTDGMLLSETQGDSRLYEYDALIIDEAHERSLNIDFLLGLLKTLLPLRPELKVIISSATLDTEKFSQAFDNASVLQVGGRMFPVEVEYMPLDPEQEEAGEVTYVDMAVAAVDALRHRRRYGDILVFMPTEQDILETCERLQGRRYPATTILPLFARLPASEQHRVYSVTGPKIVVATNVAETSLTIPGIKYVIDTGLARISRYLPRTRTKSLPISPISRGSADQRKGRCGRVANGVCIRLYSEEDFDSRPAFTPPEILRSNLAEVILRMISLNLGDPATFPFLDRPNPRSTKDGFDLLQELGAIVKGEEGYTLTEKGRIMARLPLDPRISRMMLHASNEGCAGDMAVIASALSIQDPRERPADKAALADQMHAPFKDPHSDFLTLLNIWNRYHREWEALKTQNRLRAFCRSHFLSFPRMREWVYTYEQIKAILEEQGVRVVNKTMTGDARYAAVHRSVLSGFLSNIALRKEKNIYQAARGREAMLFPGSTIFNRNVPWVVAAEMVKTSRLFARTAAKIDPEWLEVLAGDLCRSSYSEPHWERDRGEVVASEQVTLFGLVIVPKRAVSYGAINPEEAHRIFIKAALVEGDVRERLPFLIHNQDLIKGISEMEEKVRRRGILASEDEIADFYSRRLDGVCDLRTLKRFIRERGGDSFLRMKEEDLFCARPEEEELSLYPEELPLGPALVKTSYRFAPGQEDDGVTVIVPSHLVSRMPAEGLEWGVPGLLREKVTALLKGLPKRYRRQLVPVSRTVDVIMEEMEREGRSLLTTLAQFVLRRFGADIPASVWSSTEIPEHLKMRVSIVDHDGKELASGRDILLLKGEVVGGGEPEHSEEWKRAREEWERDAITSWEFGELPEGVRLGDGLVAYPGLEGRGEVAGIRLFMTPEEALASHLKGVETLLALTLAKDMRFLRKILSLPRVIAKAATHLGGAERLETGLCEALKRDLFQKDIRTREAFDAHVEAVRPILFERAGELREQVSKVILAVADVRSSLDALEGTNRSNRMLLDLCKDIREDLDALVPEDFLEVYSVERLTHVPRYLKAMEMRVERAANSPEKDLNKRVRMERFVQAFHEMKSSLSKHSSKAEWEAVEAYRWMLEEFKVSLFAQELKTAYPVSEKRLEEKKREIGRMGLLTA